MREIEDLFDAVTIAVPAWDDATIAALLPGGEGTDTLHPEPEDVGRGAPEVIEWRAPLDGVDFVAALERLELRLGTPHQMTGGPTSVRWWADASRQVILESGFRDRPLLRIVPAHWHSEAEMAAVDLGVVSREPYLWAVDLAPRSPNGVWTPGSRQPEDTDALAREVTRVLASLAHAAATLPDRLMYSGGLRLTNPEELRNENGLPYHETRGVTVVGDPWSVRITRRSTVLDEASGDPASDLPAFTERLLAELHSWPYPPEQLRVDVFAEGRVPGKRAPKRLLHRVQFTTLGGIAA